MKWEEELRDLIKFSVPSRVMQNWAGISRNVIPNKLVSIFNTHVALQVRATFHRRPFQRYSLQEITLRPPQSSKNKRMNNFLLTEALVWFY